MNQPVGEYPPLGPPAAYWCEACAARWRGYGSPTGCDQHDLRPGWTSVTVDITIRDINTTLLSMLTGYTVDQHKRLVPDPYRHLDQL